MASAFDADMIANVAPELQATFGEAVAYATPLGVVTNCDGIIGDEMTDQISTGVGFENRILVSIKLLRSEVSDPLIGGTITTSDATVYKIIAIAGKSASMVDLMCQRMKTADLSAKGRVDQPPQGGGRGRR